MAITYKEVTGEFNWQYIERTNEDGSISVIPKDEGNADYQAYLDRDNPKAALSTPIVSSDG
jgi:hypothetical protein